MRSCTFAIAVVGLSVFVMGIAVPGEARSQQDVLRLEKRYTEHLESGDYAAAAKAAGSIVSIVERPSSSHDPFPFPIHANRQQKSVSKGVLAYASSFGSGQTPPRAVHLCYGFKITVSSALSSRTGVCSAVNVART